MTTVPVDNFNNTFGTAHGIGNIACGFIVTKIGTTSPAGSEDWFEAGINCSTGLTVTLTADPGIQYHIVGASDTTLQSGLTGSTTVTSPDPFYIRIYGGAGVTGNWTLTVQG